MIHTIFKYTAILLHFMEMLVFTLLLYIASFLPAKLRQFIYQKLFQHWCRVFVRALGVDLRLYQNNSKPLPEQYIMIANHPSALEDIALPALFKVNSLAKIEVRDWWIVGKISQAAGTLYVRRESRKSRGQAVEKMVNEIHEGHNIALYPEGGCKGKRLHDHFKTGAFEVSVRTGVPIVPVFIHYEAQDDFFWWPNTPLPLKLWQIIRAQNNRANFYVFDAIYPENFDDRSAYIDFVYKKYQFWQEKYLD